MADGDLTDTELKAAKLAAQGLTINEISIEMDISFRNAKFHLDRARKKLGVKHKRHLRRALRARGLIE